MSKSTKPTLRPVAKPVTDQEKERQAQIYLANEKKTYFQIILGGLCQNPTVTRPSKISLTGPDGNTHEVFQFNIIDIVDAALEGADYVIAKLYNLEKKEDK